MNPVHRAAVESKHAEFLAAVTGLPVTAKATVGLRTIFEVSNLVAVPEGDGSASVEFLRIRSHFDTWRALR